MGRPQARSGYSCFLALSLARVVDTSANGRVDVGAVSAYRAGVVLDCRGRPGGDPDRRRHPVRLEQVDADRVETVMIGQGGSHQEAAEQVRRHHMASPFRVEL
jgi:hypothetical protein